MSLILFLVLLGLALGSFINVCIYRLPRGISLLKRSHCPHCVTKLLWFELVPLASFVLLRGKCSNCASRISWRYPVAEFFVGIFTVWLFLLFGPSLKFLAVAGFVMLMLLVAIVDWRHLIIPNRILAIGVGMGVGLGLLFSTDTVLTSLISSLCALGTMLAIFFAGNWLFKKETMGLGDVKLAGLSGLYIGYKEFLVALWLAALCGLVYGLWLKLRKVNHAVRFLDSQRLSSETSLQLPLGAFLACASSIIMILAQTEMLNMQSLVEAWLAQAVP
jgi:leader peptidase (prepilin peptidase)/N-methyltransferase